MNSDYRSNPSPEDLDYRLVQLKNGNESALEEISAAMKNKLLHKAFETLVNPSEAEDVVQDVLIAIWQKRDRLPATWREAKLYMLEMAANRAKDINRLSRSKKNVPLEAIAEVADCPLDWTNREELEILVERLRDRLLAELPARRLRVFEAVALRLSDPHRSMRDVYEDVASKLGLHWGSVRNEWSNTVRALDRLFPKPFKDDDSRALLQMIGQNLDRAEA